MELSINDRILKLESRLKPHLPETQIQRVFKRNKGFEWCIGIGVMNERKLFFYGDTIEQALTAAEAEIFKIIKTKDEVAWIFPGIMAITV